ncbi:uncharacterized protein LOC102809268 [Saccoglossus kowalevskii]|uniref:Protein notum homolog n=1 Tax=Saccoglossus kowalevskii TaxID=10224 RepID=A0ABM0MF33_SACKO|nr:PREDICTED: protein notum homolog [Saccoglossus kowalevskii]
MNPAHHRQKCVRCICNKWTILTILAFLTWLYRLIVYLSASNLQLVLVPMELANEKRAYCLDGSAPGYYFRKGHDEGENSWILYLQGGGWCWNISDCYERTKGRYGSSNEMQGTLPVGGFLSNSANSNPDFYNWNVAFFAYCDGASFAGDVNVPLSYKGNTIYFRGKRVLDLLLDYLMDKGLSSADRVILSGMSAGGLAVYIHADYIRNKFPPQTAFHAFPDAGYFPDVKNITNHDHIKEAFQNVIRLQGIENNLNTACLADQDINSKWKCFFPQYTYPYVTTPMFVLNSAYDIWSLWYILNVRCHISACDKDNLHHLTSYHDQFMQIAEPIYKSTKAAIYTSSCFSHVHTLQNTEWTKHLVNGTTPVAAFGDWYFGRKTVQQSKYWDCATPACNPTCDWTLNTFMYFASSNSKYDF